MTCVYCKVECMWSGMWVTLTFVALVVRLIEIALALDSGYRLCS